MVDALSMIFHYSTLIHWDIINQTSLTHTPTHTHYTQSYSKNRSGRGGWGVEGIELVNWISLHNKQVGSNI